MGGRGEISLSSEISDLKADRRENVTDTARARAGSSGALEGDVTPLQPAVMPAAADALVRLPDGVLGAVVFAYEAGVTAGRGGGPYAVPRDQRDDLLECVRVHGRDAKGPYAGAVLQDWLQSDGAAFARWVQALPRAIRERERWNLNPRAFLRWLNDTAQAAEVARVDEQPSGVRRAVPRMPPDAPEGVGTMFGSFAAKGASGGQP